MLGRLKVGLALGGGAARGLAHIGILKVFEKNGIPIDVIAGTSMGAIIGGKYALNPDAKGLQGEIMEFLESDTFKKSKLDFLAEDEEEPGGFFSHLAKYVSKKVYYTLAANQRSMIKEQTFWKIMEELFPDVQIENTQIPFAVTAVDLRSGSEVVLKGGPIRTMVAASCAIPGMIAPVEVEDYELVDGGWLDLVPSWVARKLGAHLVIGVWVGSDLKDEGEWHSSIDILSRADDITRHYLGMLRLRECDLVIAPQVGHHSWAGFDKALEIIEAGEKAAQGALPKIRSAISKAKLRRLTPLPQKREKRIIPPVLYP